MHRDPTQTCNLWPRHMEVLVDDYNVEFVISFTWDLLWLQNLPTSFLFSLFHLMQALPHSFVTKEIKYHFPGTTIQTYQDKKFYVPDTLGYFLQCSVSGKAYKAVHILKSSTSPPNLSEHPLVWCCFLFFCGFFVCLFCFFTEITTESGLQRCLLRPWDDGVLFTSS